MTKQSGFTLMELMIVIAIVAVVSTIAIPNFVSWFPKYRLSVASRDMVSTFQMARLKAIKANTDIVVAINLGNDTYTVFQDDGQGSGDADNNGILDDALNWVANGAERVYQTKPLPPGIDITAAAFTGAPSVRFNRRGFPVDAAGNTTSGGVTFRNNRGATQRVLLDISGNSRLPNINP